MVNNFMYVVVCPPPKIKDTCFIQYSIVILNAAVDIAILKSN